MPEEITDILLLEDSILERYGLYTDTPSNKEAWLNSQKDHGKLYNDMYEKVINCKAVKENEGIVNDIDNCLMISFKKTLSEEDVLLFEKIIEYFKKVKSFKTKIERLTRETNVQDIERLTKDYNIPLNKYIYTKFNLKMSHRSMYIQIEYDLDDLINKYKKAIEKLNDSIKFVENKRKYLENEMIRYNLGENVEKYNVYKKVTKEPSKFSGMNWSVLSIQDKFDCIREYINEKYSEKTPEFITRMYDFVTSQYSDKQLIYRNIKWVKAIGRIHDITGIQVHPENDTLEVVHRLKPAIKRTIFETDPGKVNEEMLYYIVVYNCTLEQCISRLQNMLNIQKIPFSVMKKLTLLYNEMMDIVENDSS